MSCYEQDLSAFSFLLSKTFTYIIHRPEDKVPLSYLTSEIAKTLSWDKPISYLQAEYSSIYSSYMFHDS